MKRLVWLALLFCAACGDDTQPAGPCLVNGPPEVQLGTGPADGMGYLPMAEGQMVTLTFGQQSGFHVWTNVRARNVCFKKLIVQRSATFAGASEAFSSSTSQATLVAASDPQLAAQGWGEMPASVPTFMCPNTTGMSLPGQMIRIDVTITDSEGRTASDHRTVVPECPNDTFNAACQNQCAPALSDGGD